MIKINIKFFVFLALLIFISWAIFEVSFAVLASGVKMKFGIWALGRSKEYLSYMLIYCISAFFAFLAIVYTISKSKISALKHVSGIITNAILIIVGSLVIYCGYKSINILLDYYPNEQYFKNWQIGRYIVGSILILYALLFRSSFTNTTRTSTHGFCHVCGSHQYADSIFCHKCGVKTIQI